MIAIDCWGEGELARYRQRPEKCDTAAIASKEYFDKSRAAMEVYGKELRGDT